MKKVKTYLITSLLLFSLHPASVAAPMEEIAPQPQQQQQQPYDQNKKAEKKAFIKQTTADDTLSTKFTVPQITPYQLFSGTVIPGILISGMNSDLPGSIVAQVRQNVFDTTTGQYLLIPQGSKLIGIYDADTAYAQNRGQVIWQRLIYPNGKSIVLENFVGTDEGGYAGFKDKVRSHYARVVWSALIGGAITGGVAAATASNGNDESFRAQAGASAAQNISSATNSIVNKNLNIAPTIIIRPGYKFNVFVSKDLLLEPYVE